MGNWEDFDKNSLYLGGVLCPCEHPPPLASRPPQPQEGAKEGGGKGRAEAVDAPPSQYRSFDRRHFLEYGIQNVDSVRKGYTHYTYYRYNALLLLYQLYLLYLLYLLYALLQVRQDLGIADHVWQDKRTLIAQSADNLGDQFRPAMRTGWLSYIRRAYPEDAADGAGPVVGEDMLVVPD
jgi:hypothetical protein